LESLGRVANLDQTQSSIKFSFCYGIIIALNYWSKLTKKGGPANIVIHKGTCINSIRGEPLNNHLSGSVFKKD